MHFRALQNLHIKRLQECDFDFKAEFPLSGVARENLTWWCSCYPNGKSFIHGQPDLEIFSDASLSGWGAVCDGVRTGGPWTKEDSSKHINDLELWAAYFAVKSFAPRSNCISIRIFIDNMTAVCYINKCGGTHSNGLTATANRINQWCEARAIDIEAVHLPGKLNVIADEESRSQNDSSDWRLCSRSFQKIKGLWEMNVDLFASSWNAQLTKFVAWRPQPGAWAVNAFSLHWSDMVGYISPPFALISRCIAKVRTDKASAVIVCPWWPAQPWFPSLLELVCDVPRIFSPNSDILLSVLEQRHPLSEEGHLILSAWMLSGETLKAKAFRARWSTYSWQATVNPRFLHTKPPGFIGRIGVWEGIQIPCLMI